MEKLLKGFLCGFAALCVVSWPSAHAANYAVETVTQGLAYPWSLAFLPDGGMLVTERDEGRLRYIRDGQLDPTPISGVPPVYTRGQSGLFDVALHPEFEENGLVYLALAHGGARANATRVVRGKLVGHVLEDVETIFTVEPMKATPAHYGGRLLFLPDGSLLLTTGDGFDYREQVQHLDNHLGKVLRLNDDGSAPDDNPFVGQPNALPEILTYGHRSPQGLALDSETGDVYSHEHGPRGGDELNLITAGTNYGWPIATFGLDYNGSKVSPYTEYEGTEQPLVYWTPSIAPSGLTIYRGDAFPEWNGDAFVGALKRGKANGVNIGKHIVRVDLEDGKVIGQERLLDEVGVRIRDIRTGPDGFIYVLTDEAQGKLLRLVPKE